MTKRAPGASTKREGLATENARKESQGTYGGIPTKLDLSQVKTRAERPSRHRKGPEVPPDPRELDLIVSGA